MRFQPEIQREAVIADPVLEEVAQDVERVGAGERAIQESVEPRGRFGPRGIQVQVGDEECALQATHSAFSITTGVLGTSPMPPLLPVCTALILSTVSVPSTTLPKTA